MGAKYGDEGVSSIVNIILKQKRSGGYIMTNLTNDFQAKYNDNFLTANVNYKKSEFGVLYFLSHRNYKDRSVDKITTFNDPSNTFERIQKGIKTPFNYMQHHFNLFYNLSSEEKYVFNLTFKNDVFNRDNDYNNSVTYSNHKNSFYQSTTNDEKHYIPTVDAYFRYNFPGKQSLTANLVGTYINSENIRHYNEYNDSINFIKINEEISGDKYSLISELLYEKIFDKINFSTGIKQTQSFTKNILINGTNQSNSDMNNTDSYLFAEMSGSLSSKFEYSLGLGVGRTWFREENNGFTFYSFRPSLSLAYKLRSNINLRYNFMVNTEAPSLGQLSSTMQRIDSFQFNTGNSNLKPYNVYNNKLTLNYSYRMINASLNFKYNYYVDPIMNYIYLKNGEYINTYNNQKSFENLGVYANIGLQLIKDIWQLSFTTGIDHYISNGMTYKHYYQNKWGNIGSNVYYKNFDLNLFINFRTSKLWGEEVSHGQDWQFIELGYKQKSCRFAVGMHYPFKKEWSAGEENLSKIKTEESWRSIPDNGHMLYARFSWNMSFGKKYNATNRLLNNSDNDSGIRKLD